jgi:DNA repair protein RecN (Recombination protein N)
MLRTLRIRNLVIFDDLTIRFGAGLNLITGETGAGKSILVDAIGLVSGARADRSLIRSGAASAIVEAHFDLSESGRAGEWARSQDFFDAEDDEQLIIRRELPAEGSGRIQINGSPCTLGQLREIGRRLLEMHCQHEHQSLLTPERHLALLDRLGGHRRELALLSESFEQLVGLREKREQLFETAGRAEQRRAALEEELHEIDAVNPQPGELEELDRERKLLRNSSFVAQLLEELVRLCHEGEPTATSLAFAASRQASRLAELDGSLEEHASRLQAAALELQDLGDHFRNYREAIDFDPARLERIESRRAALERLRLRFGRDEDAVLAHREEAAAELAALSHIDGELAEIEGRIGKAVNAYIGAAGAVGAKRREASRELVPAVERQFQELALEKAKFDVSFSRARGEEVELPDGGSWPVRALGVERAEFLLAANPGEAARALSKCASGGELSRVMLALHMVVEGAGGGRVLVFDEVDAGIGGAVADAVGARLAGLARKQQILCVTHLPQVAAYADRHLAVRKHSKNERTLAEIVELAGERRVRELARMLGGKRATAASMRHASELLGAAARASQASPPGS